MDELLKQKLAREMTHWQPVQSERPLADMWGGMNNMQRLGLFQIPVVSDAAGLLGDLQMYQEQPETRGLLNYGMSAAGLLPFVPGAFGRIVHHGSPHQWAPEPGFPRGRPRLDKIGTGEGAQAYGHGMYFAEKPEIAWDYAEKLSTPTVLFRNQPTSDQAKKAVEHMRTQVGVMQSSARRGEARRLWNNFDDAIKQELGDFEVPAAGILYSLDLPDERLPGLLDWDLPLSQQPEAVRKVLDQFDAKILGYTGSQRFGGAPTGEDILARLRTRAGGSPDAAAQMINELGIPGLRYLDAGSRGAGNGTYNYVIWDQNLLDEMARRMQ